MDDRNVLGKIEELVEEEQTLLRSSEEQGPDPDKHRRLEQVKVELDRCWDLLRQRRALRDAGGDPDDGQARDAETVERYLQ